MRKALVASLAIIGLASAGAWVRISTPVKLQPESRLWVDGTSTTKSFSCKAAELSADVVAADASGSPAAVRKATITVAAPKLDCGNGTMNDHMKKAIKADQFKTITFTLSNYDAAKSTINGTLVLGGQTRTISVPATTKDIGGGAFRVAGAYALSMSDYGLKAPSLMFGAMKVGNEVKVNFDLLLKAAPNAN